LREGGGGKRGRKSWTKTREREEREGGKWKRKKEVERKRQI
jgi:hypothetical protein